MPRRVAAVRLGSAGALRFPEESSRVNGSRRQNVGCTRCHQNMARDQECARQHIDLCKSRLAKYHYRYGVLRETQDSAEIQELLVVGCRLSLGRLFLLT